MKKILFTALILWFITLAGKLYSQQIPDNTTGRLWGLCKVWGYMKYYHPKICQTNWDSLVREKIPLVMNAVSNADYNTVLLDMVEELGQLTPAQATTPAANDSNLNLDTVWMNSEIFSPQLQAFLDTFNSRAGRNDSIANCYTSILELMQEPATMNTINYNTAETRLTMAFKFWNTFSYFAPYRNLTDQNWDTTLIKIIPELINGPNRKSFDLAMRKMNARIDDGHGSYQGLFSPFPFEKALGIKVERIENKAVITKVHPGINNVAVGDIILEIDGEPIDQITDSYREYIATSNDAWFYTLAYTYITYGANLGPLATQTVNIKLKNAQQEYTTALSKTLTTTEHYNWSREDHKPEWTILCNNYGYVNMNKLEPANVDAMYQALKDQPAIVFDVRSYLKTSIWELAKYFMPENAISAQFWRQTATTPGRFNFGTDQDNVDPFSNPDFYRGKIYFLVNENAISASEYFVQYMQHAPDATIIGSQTAGADGNSMMVNMTANVSYTFTRLGVAYIDGYQCQRNGIRIDEQVHPTINGIRQGIDEMLLYVSGCNTVSVNDKERDNVSMALYPNPASQELNIVMTTINPEKATIRITDIFGKTRLTLGNQVTGSLISVDIASLEPGVYFISLKTTKGQSKTMKFVKQ